jgi:hypothetical protein
MCRLILALASVVAFAGCESVPNIRFDSDSAVEDASALEASAAVEAAPDVPPVEASVCPDAGPSTVCCGSIPCLGPCDEKNCERCAACTPGSICCAQDQSQVECQPFSGGC